MKHRFLQSKYFILILLALLLPAYGFSSLPQGNNQEGWYLVSEEAIIPDHDYSIAGKIAKYMPGYHRYEDRFYEINRGSFSSNSFHFYCRQEEPDGRVMFYPSGIPVEGETTSTWSTPPSFIAAGEKVSLQVTWSPDEHNRCIRGGPTIRFATKMFFTSAGEGLGRDSFSGTLTMGSIAPRGRSGAEEILNLNVGNGYHYRYVYEWREGPPDDVAAVIPLPGPDERDREGGGGLGWIVVIGGLGVMGIGGAGLAGAAAALVLRARKKRSQNREEQPTEQEVVGYILELSTNEVFLQASKPQSVGVTCWKVRGGGSYEPAPEAELSVQGPSPASNISVTPLSGQGKMEMQINLTDESNEDTHQVVVTASGGGESTTAVVMIYIVPELEIILTTADGDSQMDMDIDGEGLWACAQVTSSFDGSSHSADQRTPNIRFRVEGANADWIELGGIVYEDEWQWVSVFARTPYAGAQLERGNPELIAEYQDEQHGIDLQARMILKLQTEYQLKVSAFDSNAPYIRYYTRDSQWHAPDLLVYWIDPDKGDEPVEPNFVYGFDDEPLTVDPPCMTLESFSEHAPNIYRMKFQVEQDLEQYFGEDLVENEGQVKLTVEAWDDKQEAHYAEIDYQVRPTAIQLFYFWRDAPHQKVAQREHYGVQLSPGEWVLDGEDTLGVGAYLVRLDRMDEADMGFEHPLVLPQPANAELGGVDRRKYVLQEASENADPNRYIGWLRTEQDEPVFYDGTDEDLVVRGNLVLDQQRYPNYHLDSHASNTDMEVRIRPLAVYLKLWVLPGGSPGTSEAGGFLYLPDKKVPLVGKELRLDIQASGGASLTTSQHTKKTNQNGIANWVLDYHGLTWKNFNRSVFTVRCGMPSSSGGYNGTQVRIDIGQNVYKTLSDLQSNRKNKVKPDKLDLENPDWEAGSGFLRSVGDRLFPDFLSGPCVNIVAFISGDEHYACYSLRDRVIEWMQFRRHVSWNLQYEGFNEEKHMSMNGIEYANYGCWFLGPIDHHFAGIYLSNKNGGPLDDPRFIDPWWNQHWSDKRYKVTSGLYTKAQEIANQAATLAITGVLFALVVAFFGWKFGPAAVASIKPKLKYIFGGAATANALRGIYVTIPVAYNPQNIERARRFFVENPPFPPVEPIIRW